MSILKYFKLAKPTDDRLLDPEGTLSNKFPSSAIASANLEICSVIDSDRHPRHVYILTVWHLLIAKITINGMEKFAKLSSAKLISFPPNFRRLWYMCTKILL